MEPIPIQLYKRLIKSNESCKWIHYFNNKLYRSNTFLFNKATRGTKFLLITQPFTKKMEKTNTKTIEKEKIVAEKLNGRFAMMGFIALIGAYLTTGQIIPGFI